jgi:hypothetical protein
MDLGTGESERCPGRVPYPQAEEFHQQRLKGLRGGGDERSSLDVLAASAA